MDYRRHFGKDHRASMIRQKLSSGRGALLVVLALLIMGSVSGCASSPTTTSPTASLPRAQVTAVSSMSQRFIGRGIELSGSGGLYMASEQVGWARPYSPTGQGSLFRTTDGGKNWKQITLPRVPEEQDFWVDVFDEDMAFLQPFQPGMMTGTVFPYFYRTVDGGATWLRWNWPTTPEIESFGMRASALTFLDHMHGWVVMSLPDQSMTGESSKKTPSEARVGMLFHTNDGGQSWQPIVHLPLPSAGSLIFIDSQTGRFSTAPDGSRLSDSSDSAVLYVTHDGGYTWKQSSVLPLPAQETRRPRSIDNLPFFTHSDGYLIVSFGKPDTDIVRYLYTTQDGGNTWQVEGAALPTNPSFDLNVVDTTHVNDGNFLFTLTNGQWMQTSSAPVGVNDVNRWWVEFLSPQVGVALMDGTDVHKTSDGGQNWQQISALPKLKT